MIKNNFIYRILFAFILKISYDSRHILSILLSVVVMFYKIILGCCFYSLCFLISDASLHAKELLKLNQSHNYKNEVMQVSTKKISKNKKRKRKKTKKTIRMKRKTKESLCRKQKTSYHNCKKKRSKKGSKIKNCIQAKKAYRSCKFFSKSIQYKKFSKFNGTKSSKQKPTSTHFYIALGTENFSINKVSNISIESNPVSAGISLGAFKYIDLLKGIYVNPYISSYAGASYNRSDSGKNIWQDSSIMQVGMNIEKRFNIKTGLFYVAPFTGFKYRSMEASADNSNQTWHMTSTSLPLGANIGFSLSKTIGMFFQIATDIFYFSQYKEVGNAKAGAATNTSSGFSYLIGVSTKF